MKHLVTNYATGDAGYGRDQAIGSWSLSESHWRLRFWQSGGQMSGPLEHTEIGVVRRRPWSSTVVLRAADGSTQGSFCLPFCRVSRVRRDVARVTRAATDVNELMERSRQGEWWLDPEALVEVGPARTITVMGARYLDGWGDRVRPFRQARRRIIDIDAAGLAVRGARHRLVIPWTEVDDLHVTSGGGGRTELSVGLLAGGEVTFEVPRYSVTELGHKLEPVTQRMRPARARTVAD